ncbi:MAG TPA: hypothetical protein PKC28_01015 [Bdellovibrionales bacterium]|nr:hypothetical protein [Bdellovibrionales bacterium]
MKLFVITFVTALVSLPTAFANEVELFELEEGAISEQDMQVLSRRGDRDDGAAIVGAIFGAISAEIMERESGGRGGGWGGHRPRFVECYARPARGGRTFAVSGRRPRMVQAAAIDKCERRTGRMCRPLGCR